jgi:hypothetical protein
MSDETYANLDAIPDSIFDNIIIDNSLNMDDIFDDNFSRDSELLSLLYDDDASEELEVVNNFQVELNEIIQESPNPHVKHDCMWSGTCKSEDHKKRNTKPFSVQGILKEFEESSAYETSDMGRSKNLNTKLKFHTFLCF